MSSRNADDESDSNGHQLRDSFITYSRTAEDTQTISERARKANIRDKKFAKRIYTDMAPLGDTEVFPFIYIIGKWHSQSRTACIRSTVQ